MSQKMKIVARLQIVMKAETDVGKHELYLNISINKENCEQ